MEKNIAILMADLSGYTALTETHGSIAAADIIDKYIGIVENCLVGDCRVHERTGDELMIVSDSPDFLLATALMIGKNTSNEENFLQVQHDVGDVFNDTVDGGEFVHRTIHFDRGDGRAFQRGEQHPANRVADGVAIAGFKRLSDEFCVCFRCAGFFFHQTLRHFETT